MNFTRNRALRAAVTPVVAATFVAGGCSHGSHTSSSSSKPAQGAASTCPTVLNTAKRAVAHAEDVNAPWDGPTSGPRAVPGKSIVYVAETMINPGVASIARAVQEAGRTIGWDVRVIDGQGTPAGIQAAFAEAVALNPSGIVVGAFDPNSATQQVKRANDAHIPIIGWHAAPLPGPSVNPKLFTNITTRVEDVARITAYWIIAESKGNAGAVIFTDSSVPFASNKAKLIRKALLTCSGVKVLSYENIPVADASSRMPQEVSSLLSRFGDRWTHSAAINDLYFADAAPTLRGAGKKGDEAPFSIAAGDGDPSAFARIRDRQFQAATVPEPLNEQGSQIIDEFNRAFAGRPASGYVAPTHLITTRTVDDTTSWDPRGYRAAYKRIWGV